MTLVLQSEGWASGVQRVTTADAAIRFGGISADGSTVAFQSRATNLVAGSTDPDLYLYDVPGDTVTATGAEPQEWNPVATPVLSGDGSTVVYEEEVFDDEIGLYRYMRSYDVATGTVTQQPGTPTSRATTPSRSRPTAPCWPTSSSEPAGPTSTCPPRAATSTSTPPIGFTYDTSVSDDGRYVSVNGNGARVYDRTTSSFTGRRLGVHLGQHHDHRHRALGRWPLPGVHLLGPGRQPGRGHRRPGLGSDHRHVDTHHLGRGRAGGPGRGIDLRRREVRGVHLRAARLPVGCGHLPVGPHHRRARPSSPRWPPTQPSPATAPRWPSPPWPPTRPTPRSPTSTSGTTPPPDRPLGRSGPDRVAPKAQRRRVEGRGVAPPWRGCFRAVKCPDLG